MSMLASCLPRTDASLVTAVEPSSLARFSHRKAFERVGASPTTAQRCQGLSTLSFTALRLSVLFSCQGLSAFHSPPCVFLLCSAVKAPSECRSETPRKHIICGPLLSSSLTLIPPSHHHPSFPPHDHRPAPPRYFPPSYSLTHRVSLPHPPCPQAQVFKPPL